jgi:hypothetical protein
MHKSQIEDRQITMECKETNQWEKQAIIVDIKASCFKSPLL